MSYQKTHLITPPTSTKATTPHHDFAEKSLVVNNYIQNAAVYVISLWQDPTTTDNQSLFGTTTLRPEGYEHFLREILKRSRCSIPALQVTLFYLSKLQQQIKSRLMTNNSHLMCPKKVFLLCLILSFKYNHDSNYSFKAWTKISGLSVEELKLLEIDILKNLDYNLNLNNDSFTQWVQKSNAFNSVTQQHNNVKRMREEHSIDTTTTTPLKKVKAN